MAIYHRIETGRKNQSIQTALSQIHTKEIWGRTSFNTPGFPAVKALYGPLPDKANGIEFETTTSPTLNSSTTSEAYWYLDGKTPGVSSDSTGDFARIAVSIRLVRYTSGTILSKGVEWSP